MAALSSINNFSPPMLGHDSLNSQVRELNNQVMRCYNNITMIRPSQAVDMTTVFENLSEMASNWFSEYVDLENKQITNLEPEFTCCFISCKSTYYEYAVEEFNSAKRTFAYTLKEMRNKALVLDCSNLDIILNRIFNILPNITNQPSKQLTITELNKEFILLENRFNTYLKFVNESKAIGQEITQTPASRPISHLTTRYLKITRDFEDELAYLGAHTWKLRKLLENLEMMTLSDILIQSTPTMRSDEQMQISRADYLRDGKIGSPKHVVIFRL